jgi:hypothetical protein
MSGPGREATEMLETIEARLRAALDVVGSRWSAISAGEQCPPEDLLYCEGFFDGLMVLLGTDDESREIVNDLAAQWATGRDLEATDGAAA